MATSDTSSITGTNISTRNGADAFPRSILQKGSITAAAGEFILVDPSTEATTVKLPATPGDESTVTVKPVTSGYASPTDQTPYAVTVQCGGSDTIDKNSASVQLSTWGQTLTLQYDSAHTTWVTVSDNMTSSQLDGRYERVVSVKAAPFNAKGDGKTNDTKAIQAAINYATSIDAVTFFPSSGEACYRVDQLVLPPGAILEGVSSGSYGASEEPDAKSTQVISGVSTLARREGTNSPLLLIPDGYNYCRIRDIEIDGNGLNNTEGDGIRIEDGTAGQEGQIIIDRCYVHDNPGHNIYLGQGRRANKVLNSVCNYAGTVPGTDKDKAKRQEKDGICVAGSDNTVAHNICGSNGRAGINLGTTEALEWHADENSNSAAVTHVISNDVYKNLVGINVSSGSWGNVISSNGIDRNMMEGVAVYDGDVSATILANVFHSNGNTADPDLPQVEGAYPHIGLSSSVNAVHIAANIFGPRDGLVKTMTTYGVYAASPSTTKVHGGFGIIETKPGLESTQDGLSNVPAVL
jgi:hypothetical protein